MKKFIIAALIAVTFTTTVFASETKVNYKALNHFTSVYSNAKSVTWETKEKFIRATFIENGEKTEVYYTTDGDLIGTSNKLLFKDLPSKVIKAVKQRYTETEYTVGECISFTNDTDVITYYVTVENEKEKKVLSVTESGSVSVFKRTKNN